MLNRFKKLMTDTLNYTKTISQFVTVLPAKVKSSISTIGSVLPYFRPRNNRDLVKIVGAAGLTAVSVGLNVYMPVIFRRVSGMVEFGSDEATQEQNARNYQDQLTYLIVGYGVCWTIAQVGNSLHRLVIVDIADNAVQKFEDASINDIKELSYPEYIKLKPGEVSGAIQRASGYSGMLGQVLFTQLIPISFELLLTSYSLTTGYGATIGLSTLGIIVACSTYTFATMDLKKGPEERLRESQKKTDARLNHLIQNYESIHLSNNWQNEIIAYNALLKEKGANETQFFGALEVTPMGQSIILGVALVWILSKISRGDYNLKDFNTINLQMMRFIERTIGLNYTLISLRHAQSNIETSYEMLRKFQSTTSITKVLSSTTPKPTPKSSLRSHLAIKGNWVIHFAKVKFSYTKETALLEEITFSTKSGQITAVVGKTGSGKSSLSRLLYRFYSVDQGDIRINDQNIEDIDLLAWREKVAIASQEPKMMGDATLYESLAYGSKHISRTEVEQLVEAVGLKECIEQQKQGYATPLQDLNLSGGQKQKVALVRTLLKDAEIYVFDEVTSALDVESKDKVMSVIKKMMADKIVFVITHDLALIPKHCSNIVVIDEGRIAQTGTHDQLIKVDGLYSELFNKRLDDADHSDERKNVFAMKI